MFGWFKKTPLQKLEKEYYRLMDESFKMSTINRAESDKLTAKAYELAAQIDKLTQNKK